MYSVMSLPGSRASSTSSWEQMVLASLVIDLAAHDDDPGVEQAAGQVDARQGRAAKPGTSGGVGSVAMGPPV